MGRRGRSFFGFVLVGAGALAIYLWRNRRVRDYTRALLAPATDCLRDFVRRTLKQQPSAHPESAKPKVVITGLVAPEVRPLSTAEQLLAWSPDPAANSNPDEPFCRSYNAPLLLPPPAPLTPAAAAPASSTASLPAGGRGGDSGGGQGGGGGGGSGGGAGATAGSSGCGRDGGGAPRLLVCHDMMGGYLADRFVQGSSDAEAFRLWQWDQIDVFIYFSHHMVSIPPPGWIAAAHRNGVRVLGTFITEWDQGRAVCEQALFPSAAAARAAADRLVTLAATHGFEGWLLNVENGLRPELVAHLQHFVGYLRARMAAVVGPQALVIWYDAITSEGRLAWQDGLTPLNQPFFDAADALFVNYRWGEGAPARVAAAAGSRAAEVFMGVDVFGRGSYGGGKDNCPVALAAARSAGLSAALFAPGWVYEEFDRTTFEPRQEAFWAAIRAVWPPRRPLVRRLPLATTFNCGAGRAVWLEGRRVSEAPWHNMAAMDVVATTTATTMAAAAATTAVAAAGMAAAGYGEEQEAAAAGGRGGPEAPPPSPLVVSTTQHLAFCGGSCLALTAPPPPRHTSPPLPQPAAPLPQPAPAPTRQAAGELPSSSALLLRGPWSHTLFTANVPVPAAGLDLSYVAAHSGTSRVAVLLRTAAAAPGGEAVGGVGGGTTACGVAVGPWGAGDKAVVEALQRQGYTCISCPAAPTGATICPLAPGPLAAASTPLAPAASPSAAAALPSPSAPGGLPWVSYSAHLPASLLMAGAAAARAGAGAAATAAAAPGAAGSGGGVVLTAVGLVCYRAGIPGGGPLLGPSAGSGAAGASGGAGGGGGGGTGRSSARGSATGHVTPVAAAAAATAAAMTSALSAVLGGGDEAAPYQAFLGRLVLRESCHAATGTSVHHPTATAAPSAPQPGAPADSLVAAAGVTAEASPVPRAPCPPPLAHGRCSRVRWSRPGGALSSRARSLRSSFNSLTAAGRVSEPGAGGGAAVAAAGSVGRDPRVSEEQVERTDDEEEEEEDEAMEAVFHEEDEDEDWEQSSSGNGGGGGSGGAFVGGSPVKVLKPPAAAAAATGEEDDGDGEDDGGSTAAAAAGTCSRLLTCELSWEPQFDMYGMPRHRSYHVWAHFHKEPAPPPRPPAPVPDGAHAGGSGPEAAWEVLHPDWSGAVWAGEAFVARYRLVQLEVPDWAASVSLVVQPVGWASCETQQPQQLARLAAPAALPLPPPQLSVLPALPALPALFLQQLS